MGFKLSGFAPLVARTGVPVSFCASLSALFVVIDGPCFLHEMCSAQPRGWADIVAHSHGMWRVSDVHPDPDTADHCASDDLCSADAIARLERLSANAWSAMSPDAADFVEKLAVRLRAAMHGVRVSERCVVLFDGGGFVANRLAGYKGTGREPLDARGVRLVTRALRYLWRVAGAPIAVLCRSQADFAARAFAERYPQHARASLVVTKDADGCVRVCVCW